MNSRDKGKRGEREAAAAMVEHLGCEARRGVQFQGGQDSPDVRHSIEGVHVEVKRTETFNAYNAMDQAKHDGAGKVPIVLHKRNHREWLVVVPLARLRELVEKINANYRERPPSPLSGVQDGGHLNGPG